MNTNVNGYFWFSFGGNTDIGEYHRIVTTETINFPIEHEVGYGAAIRNGMEIDDFNNYAQCNAVVFVSNPVVVTVEYPANKPTSPQDIKLEVGENSINFKLPTDCILNEVKFFISYAKNSNLTKTDFQLKSWEFC